MLPPMVEDGPESFVERWKAYAGDATLFARPEGSPLLEAGLGATVVQLLERTNPYLATPGPARLLVNATADRIDPAEDDRPTLEVPSRGSLAGRGRVLEREGRIVALDAGWPLLLELTADGADGIAEGSWIDFVASPPLHGFVLAPERRSGPEQGRDVDEAH